MSLGLRLYVSDMVGKVSAKNDQMLLRKILRAMKNHEEGCAYFAKGDMVAAIQKHEAAMAVIPIMPETERFLAVIQGALVSDYAVTGRFNDAVAIGKKALKHLTDDGRLGMAHAKCLHDMGGALVNLGHYDEGIEHMEKALRIYETVTDGAEGAARCLRNLQRIKAKRPSNNAKPASLLSRLFGR